MKKKRLLTLLVALLAVTTGAWADETLLLTIESTDNTTFTSGSKTFDDKVTITFSSWAYNDGNNYGWYTDAASLLTVAGTNGYTITSCKFYTNEGDAVTGYTVQGESPSVYLSDFKVYPDDSKSVNKGGPGITKIEVYTAAPAVDVPKHLITATYREQTRSLEQPLPYATTIGELYESVTGNSFSDLISSMSAVEMPLTGISSNNTSVVSIGELNGASTPVTVNADSKATISINFGSYAHGILVSVTSPLYAYMKDGVKDADKWTAKVGEGQAQALPIGGLKGDGSETVTLQYNGRLKVKGVKATSGAAGIVNPVVGQVIGSDGNNYDANATLPDGVTAVAKVCYVDGNGHGLALALTDEGQMNWSTAQTTCAAHTPAITGGTWKLATKDEWQQMIDAVGGFNNLKNGFSSVGGTNLQSNGYWTNTEYESENQMAYLYYFNSNMLNKSWKTNSIFVRACLAF